MTASKAFQITTGSLLTLALLAACTQVSVEGPPRSDAALHPQAISWQIETLENPLHALHTSLALDGDHRPHISYKVSGSTEDMVHYAFFDGDSWQSEEIDSSDFVGDTSLAVDRRDRPHISYSEVDRGVLYAFFDGSSWRTETVDEDGIAFQVSLALDSHGQPHISYHEGSVGLKYASSDGVAWETETVDGKAGFVDMSLALNDMDQPHIAYVDRFEEDLKYAFFDGDGWAIQAVDREDVAGPQGTTLALDRSGRPHIAYVGADDLKYAHWDGSSWQVETVDSAEERSAHLSLALDALDRPHISYQQRSGPASGDLQYAFFDGGNWQTEAVQSGRDVGRYSSLAVEGIDRPHISYQAFFGSEVRYAVGLIDSDGDGIPDGSDPDTVGEVIGDLPDEVFEPVPSANGRRTAFLSRLEEIKEDIKDGNTEEAIEKLQDLRKRVDGCPDVPTESESADRNDWIAACDAQREVRALIDMLITNLSS